MGLQLSTPDTSRIYLTVVNETPQDIYFPAGTIYAGRTYSFWMPYEASLLIDRITITPMHIAEHDHYESPPGSVYGYRRRDTTVTVVVMTKHHYTNTLDMRVNLVVRPEGEPHLRYTIEPRGSVTCSYRKGVRVTSSVTQLNGDPLLITTKSGKSSITLDKQPVSDANGGVYIYTLALGDKKYYVGKTCDVARRLNEHKSGTGSEWTRRYADTLQLLTFEESTGEFAEDNQVKSLMKIHGIDNVRGGTYSQVVLTTAQRDALEAELTHAADACFICGGKGHYAKVCPTKAPKPAKPAVKKLPRQCSICESPAKYQYCYNCLVAPQHDATRKKDGYRPCQQCKYHRCFPKTGDTLCHKCRK